MASAPSIDWEPCTVEGCAGSRSHENRRCLAHLAADELSRALDEIARDGKVDARGVEISSELLPRILDALPRTPDGERQFGEVDFRNATFTGEAIFRSTTFASHARFDGTTFKEDAWFSKTTFKGYAEFREACFAGDASFTKATFEGDASFTSATFEGDAQYDKATFEGDAWFMKTTFKDSVRFREATLEGDTWFGEATFNGDAWFSEATFKGQAWFGEATFEGDARATKATFEGDAWFGKTTFKGYAEFRQATFERDARFDGATFEGDAEFGEVTYMADAGFAGANFEGNAGFGEVTFERARRFGPVLVLDTLLLDGVSFPQAAELDISARRLSLVGTSFPARVNIQARWAEVILEGADFGAPSILCGSRAFEGLHEESLVQALKEEGSTLDSSGRPRLVSLRRANVGNLLLSDIDLRGCRFVKAHHLDGLRLQGDVEFARSPDGPWWTARRVLAEEHQWRSATEKGRLREGWYGDEVQPPGWLLEAHPEVQEALDAYFIANLYRDLRKGREDNKDEPGAADFYYGEMEMRRFDETKPQAERFILTLYWLVSGYGLRASRALISLLLTVLVFASLFWWVGFTPRPSFTRSLLFSLESTSSLFRVPETPTFSLTQLGEALQIALRLLGPLFFGLALLSLRGRVKR
jgi:uncharacterized protein YjbI with pentapeptide repeats